MPVTIESFEDQNLDSWVDEFNAGWGTDTAQSFDGTVSAYLSTDSNDATDTFLYSTSGLSGYLDTGETAHVRVYIGTGADNAEILFAWGVQDANDFYYGLKTAQGGLELHMVVSGTDTLLNDTSGSNMITGEFLELEVSGWDSSGNMTFTVYTSDGTEDLSVSGRDSGANFTSGGVGFGVGEGGPSAAEFWVDDVVNESASVGSTTTPYLGLTQPEKGTEDWHIPLNDNFGLIEDEVVALANELGVSAVGGYAQPSKGTTDWDTILNDNFGLIEADVSDLANALSDSPSVGGYAQPTEGATDWHIPLNDNFAKIDDNLAAINSAVADFQLTGEQKVWHRVGVVFDGPTVSESDATNPFTDYRMDVTFTGPSGQQYDVPGHFAADGDAAETSASSGAKWRAYLMPDEAGTWDFSVSFTTGSDVAMNGGGTATAIDGATGSLDVQATDKTGRDFRARGPIEYVNEHYLRFAGTGEVYIKNGVGGPENFMGYYEFDQTSSQGGESPSTSSNLHEYATHESDWNSGDPTWQGVGQGIIGAINYLASKGVNSLYGVMYNIDGGDGQDVWPWMSTSTKERFDVSKLDQWEIVFRHANAMGIRVHYLLHETENDAAMDAGDYGRLHQLYYREIISRFAHLPGIRWNVGEEITADYSDAMLADHLDGLAALDPYDHPRTFHQNQDDNEGAFDAFLGTGQMAGPSFQTSYNANPDVINLWNDSEAAGEPWVIGCDEADGGDQVGVPPDGLTVDGVTQTDVRKQSMWPHLLGGAGLEWYPGSYWVASTSSEADDIRWEDFRERDNWFDWMRYARSFMASLPVLSMAPDNSFVSDGYAMADPGNVYAVYLADGTTDIDLPSGDWIVEWFDPVGGGYASTETVAGGSGTSLSVPSGLDDAAARLTPA